MQPDALWIIDQTSAPTATLFACHPPGSVSQRIVVHLLLAHHHRGVVGAARLTSQLSDRVEVVPGGRAVAAAEVQQGVLVERAPLSAGVRCTAPIADDVALGLQARTDRR